MKVIGKPLPYLLVALALPLLSACANDEDSEMYNAGDERLATSATPKGGIFPLADNLEVTLRSNRDAVIYYSIDGSAPRIGGAGTFKGSSPIPNIPIEQDTELRFYAVDAEGNQEPVKLQTYEIDEEPISSIDEEDLGGTFIEPLEVDIRAEDDTAALKKGEKKSDGCKYFTQGQYGIYYTLAGAGGAAPDIELIASPPSIKPVGDTKGGKGDQTVPVGFEVLVGQERELTLKYFSVDCFGSRERVKEETYYIDRKDPITGIDPPAGSYTGAITLVLTTDEPATIYYTTDCSEPSDEAGASAAEGGNTFSGEQVVRIPISTSTRLRYFAVDQAGRHEGGEGSLTANYLIGGDAILCP